MFHKYLLLVLMLFLSVFGLAQENQNEISNSVSVEKSIFGAQIGIFGIWLHHEARLSNKIALRSEIGLDTGLWWGEIYKNTGLVAGPVLTLEPRWYYNINKRNRKGKSTSDNSGNFISIKTSYHPDWFVISNYQNIRIVSDISFVPTWGIRRNIGKKLNFETGIGLGYWTTVNTSSYWFSNLSGVAGNLHLRFGYKF
ncbi:MAG TPA: hypothetical protein VFD80_07245 [Flavobacteriaceae bacterium]|nr:hypothetical protein [Flavobacteriaceae bacterium]